MSDELELVRDYMAHEEDRASDLAIARSILEAAIASEIDTPRTAPRARRLRWALRLSVGAAAAIAACVVLVLQIVPTARISTPVAAAAQLSHLADVVQPAVPLQAGQWSTYQMQGVVDASVSSIGKTPTPDAKSSIPLSYQVWSNSTGSACISQQFGTASFASPTNAAAWQAIGLIDTPSNQPATGCVVGGAGERSGLGPQVIDVSNLTHDPTTLAEQLRSGSTGIQILDQAAVGNGPNAAGFIRLTILLIGPTIDQWTGFGQEMLRTMSLLPGVIGQGEMTAHSGKSGLAFAGGEQVTLNPETGAVGFRWMGPTVILDAQTGALLEARSFSLPTLLQSAAQAFVGSPDAPAYTQGASYGVTADWIDPVGSPTVVTQDALPGWISNFHIIVAVTLPTTSDADLIPVISPFLGNGNMDILVPGAGPGITHDIIIIGSQAKLVSVVAALTNSGLFSSVTVQS
jgi:hypothetical protein